MGSLACGAAASWELLAALMGVRAPKLREDLFVQLFTHWVPVDVHFHAFAMLSQHLRGGAFL